MLQLPLLAYLLLVPVSPFGGNHGLPAPPPPPPPANFPPPATAPKVGGNTGAPSSGSGGGATAPAKPNAGPATGTRPVTPVGPNTGRPYRAPAGATATAMNTSTVDLTTWEYWWLYNKDRYLDIKRHIAASMPNTGLDAEAEAARAWDLAGERIFTELLTVLKDEQAHEPALAAMVA